MGVYLSRFRRTDGEDVTYLRFAFCGNVSDPDPSRKLDDGILRTVWMTPAEVRASQARHRSPLVLQSIEDHLAGRRYPLQLLTAHPSLYDPWIPG